MIRITAHRWLTVPVALAVGLLSACTTTQSGSSVVGDESTAQADKAAALAQEQGPNAAKLGAHFGPEAMFRNALSEAKLSADQQKTVDAALATAFPGKEGGKEGAEDGVMKPFFGMLADQVRSGKIDEAALNAKAAELSTGTGDHRAKMAQAIQTVHDTLTPDQRATVAASIQDKMLKFEALEGKGEGRHHEKGEKGEKGEHHGMGKLGFLLHGVDLQDGQLDKIKTALEAAGIGKDHEKDHEGMEGKRAEMKQHMQAMLEAFKADQFDAKTALPERHEEAGEHLTHLVKAMSVIVPLLDDTQRAALAKNVENGPQRPMWRGHGGAPGAREQAPAETNE